MEDRTIETEKETKKTENTKRTVVFDSDFFKTLSRLKMLVKIKPSAGLSGNRKSGAKGSSLEFSDFREYIPGDDLRRIDWNVYGRTDKLLVKLFVEEKEGLFKIFIDGSTSMDYGKFHKGDYASRLSAALIYMILNQLDRVKLVTADESGIFSSGAMTGRQSFHRFLAQLERSGYAKDYDLWNVVKNEPYASEGVTILLSDFYIQQDIEDVLKFLAYRKQKVLLVHVLSQEELEPDMEGTLRLIDSEDDSTARVTMAGDLLKQYDQTLRGFISHCEAMAVKYGAAYVLAPTSRPLEETLLTLFETLRRNLY